MMNDIPDDKEVGEGNANKAGEQDMTNTQLLDLLKQERLLTGDLQKKLGESDATLMAADMLNLLNPSDKDKSESESQSRRDEKGAGSQEEFDFGDEDKMLRKVYSSIKDGTDKSIRALDKKIDDLASQVKQSVGELGTHMSVEKFMSSHRDLTKEQISELQGIAKAYPYLDIEGVHEVWLGRGKKSEISKAEAAKLASEKPSQLPESVLKSDASLDDVLSAVASNVGLKFASS